MKINGPLDPLYANQNASAANAANNANATQAAKGTTPVDRNSRSTASEASSSSHVTFSDQAKVLQKARAALEETPDVRIQRVEEIKAAIANGTYRLDLRDLAQKIQTLLK
jgi:negative regulator of flagellin synthesis FlgM